jgi:MFS family permease
MAVPKLTSSHSKIPSTPKRSAFAALKHRDFRLLWLGQIVSVTGSQMQFVAINWHVYILTKSAFALGLVGLFRGLPIIVCSLVGGVLADAVDRRRLMIVTQTVMLICAAGLTAATLGGLRSVWPIYLLSCLASAATAFDIPARQSLMPNLVPTEDFQNAVSLGMVVFNVATISGPAIAGFILAGSGPAIIYGINALSFLAVIAALAAMSVSGRPEIEVDRRKALSFTALKEGLQFVWRTPIIVQTMTLDFAATFFGSATLLLPVFAQERLHVDARGYGFLAAAPALGSVVTALLMARLGTFRRQGRTVVVSVAIFGVATAAFGLSTIFWLSLLLLAITGAADTVSTVLRQTIRQLVTPNYLRGRMTSINMMFFMGGPQLGELEAGSLAHFIGAPLSVITGGFGSLICACIAAIKSKSLMDYEGK